MKAAGAFRERWPRLGSEPLDQLRATLQFIGLIHRAGMEKGLKDVLENAWRYVGEVLPLVGARANAQVGNLVNQMRQGLVPAADWGQVAMDLLAGRSREWQAFDGGAAPDPSIKDSPIFVQNRPDDDNPF